MDEEKKSESSWEEAEQVPQDEYSQRELYRATHETSGAPALVLKRATKDAALPAGRAELPIGYPIDNTQAGRLRKLRRRVRCSTKTTEGQGASSPGR